MANGQVHSDFNLGDIQILQLLMKFWDCIMRGLDL